MGFAQLQLEYRRKPLQIAHESDCVGRGALACQPGENQLRVCAHSDVESLRQTAPRTGARYRGQNAAYRGLLNNLAKVR